MSTRSEASDRGDMIETNAAQVSIILVMIYAQSWPWSISSSLQIGIAARTGTSTTKRQYSPSSRL